VRETIATTSLAAKTGIITKSTNTRVEETKGAEEKKIPYCYFHGKEKRPLDK